MYRTICFGALLLLALPATRAVALDKVKLLDGKQSAGTLSDISPTELVITVGEKKRTVAVNEVDTVSFDGEPNDLAQARIAVRGGRYDDALKMLDKIDLDASKRAELLQDVEFYKAIAATRLALSGSGSKAEAGKKLLAFEKAYRKSFHYFETCEALGDLLTSLNKPDQAEAYYEKLATAPWPEYKSKAGVALGRALVAQKQYERALSRFTDVLATEGTGKEAEKQKLAASLGKAAALTGAGKTDEAINSLEEIIAQTDAENQDVHARAYITLGNAYNASGKKKDALLAFLHVDLLYPRMADQHAEALANLATLWQEMDKADRATEARNALKEKYPNSSWNGK